MQGVSKRSVGQTVKQARGESSHSRAICQRPDVSLLFFCSSSSIRLDRCTGFVELIFKIEYQGGHVDPPSSPPHAHPLSFRSSLSSILILSPTCPFQSHSDRVLLQERFSDREKVLQGTMAAGKGSVRRKARRETARRRRASGRRPSQAELTGKRRGRERCLVGISKEIGEERGWEPVPAGQEQGEWEMVVTYGRVARRRGST
jgi:hypothetical protein